MRTSLPLCVVAISALAAAQSSTFESRRLGVIPDDISLRAPPTPDPDGDVTQHTSQIVWSPDGTRFAYVGYRGNTSYPVFDEAVGDEYHYISPPAFSADSQHAVFRVGNRRTKKTEEWWPLVNGEKGKRFDWIGEIGIGPNGTLAFWEQPGAKIRADGAYNQGRQVLHFGKRKSRKWDNARSLFPPTFSVDGKSIATIGMRGDSWFVTTIDSRGKSKNTPKRGLSMINGVTLSPDGKRYACTAAGERGGPPAMPGAPGMMPGMKFVVRNDKGDWYGTEFDSAGCAVFAPDSKRFVYKFVDGKRMAIAFDNGRAAKDRFEYVTTPVWSPDSKRIAYGAYSEVKLEPFYRLERYADHIVEGGKAKLAIRSVGEEPKLEDEVYDAIQFVTFSPDGKRIAFVAKLGAKWHVVEGARRSEAFDQVGAPVFDPASERIGFGARAGKEVWWKVID